MADKRHTTRILVYNQCMKVILNNTIIGESMNTIIVEGNHYFPKDSLNMDFFTRSKTITHCPWKGEASYYTIKINDDILIDAAWSYENPTDLAVNIKDYVAFWKDVQVVDN